MLVPETVLQFASSSLIGYTKMCPVTLLVLHAVRRLCHDELINPMLIFKTHLPP